jgi:hypothetical protein
VRRDSRPSTRDWGWAPFQDQGDQEIPLVANRLQGGCSVAPHVAEDAAVLPLAVLALLLLARRRFAR